VGQVRKLTEDEIDNIVERWHNHEWRRLELWQALGWTLETYKHWVVSGDVPIAEPPSWV
jgi:hypothetical protein